jgi:hypothetical protein
MPSNTHRREVSFSPMGAQHDPPIGYLNLKIPIEDIPLENSGYLMEMAIAPKSICARKGCEINREYWS